MAGVAVLGAGSWGTALSVHLAKMAKPVYLWSRNKTQTAQIKQTRVNERYFPDFVLPDSLTVTDDLSDALKVCDTILIALPSEGFRAILQQIAPCIDKQKHLLVWATKGIDKTQSFLHQLVEETFTELPYAIIAGPSFAKEVILEKPTAIVIASPKLQTAEQTAKIFNNHYFRVYASTDVLGVQLGGAAKNIFAIAAGIADGLELGANARSALLTRGLSELCRLGQAIGAQQETLMGLAGLGDLILTCTDNQSRNRRFGLALGQGYSIEAAVTQVQQVVEGITATSYIYQLAQKHQVEVPIIEQVYQVLQKKYLPHEAVKHLLARPIK